MIGKKKMSMYLETIDSLCKVLNEYGTTEFDGFTRLTFKCENYEILVTFKTMPVTSNSTLDKRDEILISVNIGKVMYCPNEDESYPIANSYSAVKHYVIAVIKKEKIYKSGGILRLAADIIDHVNFFRSRNITKSSDDN